MTDNAGQRTIDRQLGLGPGGNDSNDANSLAETRASLDRLFAVATDAFDRMRTTNSQEFLHRSRQTGGQ